MKKRSDYIKILSVVFSIMFFIFFVSAFAYDNPKQTLTVQSPFIEWVNITQTLQTSTNLNPVYITNLNTTLQPNSWYNFYCKITFASNITTNGIRIGIRENTNPLHIITNIKISQAGAGTDSFMEHQGDVKNYYNVTSTGVVSVAVNYSAIIDGEIMTNGNTNYVIPYFSAENTTRLTNISGGFCKWTKIK